MSPAEQRRMLVIQAVAFVSAVYAYVITRLRIARTSQPRITIAPMSAMDLEGKPTLT
jgi:hypothetical protein